MEIKSLKQNLVTAVPFAAILTGAVFLLKASVSPAYAYDCSDVNDLALVCLENIFKNSLAAVLGLTGIISFLFIIKGGFQYTTAGGDMKAMDSARKTLTWAITGLFFSVTAYSLLKALGESLNYDILRFIIPSPA